MPGGELEPIGRSGPALAEVAAEMSEIFARAGVGQPVPGLRRPSAVSALRPSRNGNATVTLLVAAAAGLAGLGAGAFVIRTPSAPVPAEARIAAAQSPPQAAPQPQGPAQPQASATSPALAQADPAPKTEAAPAQAHPAGQSASTRAKAAARARARFRMKLAKLGDARSASARSASARAAVRTHEPTPMAQPASCEQDAEGEECRRAVIDADRHLRAVYESAIRRGVSRGVLVDYRDRWADLRDQHTEDPTRLIESYGALAYDLGRETPGADDQEDGARPRGRSGLKALADLLLPWR